VKVRTKRKPLPSESPTQILGHDSVPITDAARLVTLDDPGETPEVARDSFARLRPPEGTSAEDVTRWRARVATVARAVRALPPPRAALVALAHARPEGGEVGTIREESDRIARETGDDEVVNLVTKILDEVGVQ
jgi:hypothetical protein